MKRTVTKSTVKRTPIVTPTKAIQPEVSKAPPPVKRTASPKAPNSMSLDDLFGAPAGDNKPMRLRSNRRKPKKK